MDKRIGSIISLILFFSFNFIQAENEKITVNVTNKYQNSVNSVEIGVPFLVTVTCEGFRPDQDIKGFEFLNDCTIQPYSTAQSSSYANGRMTEKYIFTYVGVANKKGALEFGPVLVQDVSGRTIASQKITIQVTDIQEYEHTGKEPYILDVSVDQAKVYVGERLKIVLRFCYLARFENLAIENIAIEDVEFGPQDKEWKNSKVTLAGKTYSCKEMTFELYPKKVGALIIPSCKASFIQEQSQDIGLFSLFGFSNSKVIESHPKQIEVLPLPVHSRGKVDAIGKFDSVELQIMNKNAQAGEGIVAKMIVRGTGNFAVMHHPQFHAPEGIHFYEGNSSVDAHQKTFEWVLQSDEPGVFTIEPQIFTYFDPIDKTYKQLLTKSVQLTIQGVAIPTDNQEEIITIEISPEQQQVNSDIDEPLDDLSLNVKTKKYYSAEKFYKPDNSQLLQKWIIVILVLLLLLVLFFMIKPYLMKMFFIQALSYRMLFLKYYHSSDVTNMYQLFERLAKDYDFGLQSLELQDCFLKINLSNDAFENWKNFINMLLEFNFSREKSIEDKRLALDLAKQWFGIILNCCKQIKKEK